MPRDGVCWADGLVDFRAVDPVAKTSAEGVATFEYQLILWGDAMKISLETGEVKSRTIRGTRHYYCDVLEGSGVLVLLFTSPVSRLFATATGGNR